MGIRATMVLAGAAVLALGGCAGTPPVEVTRFHLNGQIARGAIVVQPRGDIDNASLEYRNYSTAVGVQLAQIGFTPVQDIDRAQYVATVSYQRGTRRALAGRGSPVSVGVGGATGGYGSGLGLGLGINLSGRPKDTTITQLNVQIKERASADVLWEGRAVAENKEGSEGAQPAIVANRLAAAMFKDYPGRSGETITVK